MLVVAPTQITNDAEDQADSKTLQTTPVDGDMKFEFKNGRGGFKDGGTYKRAEVIEWIHANFDSSELRIQRERK